MKVVLADDHRMIRQGLRVLLQGEADFEVVGEASDGREAVQLVKELSPDILIMDLHMPELNGIEATRQALDAGDNLKVIGLSAQADQQAAGELLRAGASGFVPKESAFEELIVAVRAVTAGKVYLSPTITRTFVEEYLRGSGELKSAFLVLSPREREVLQLLAEGNPTKQIARLLHVSVKTVETHRRNLMEKLGLDSVAALTKYAVRERITSL